ADHEDKGSLREKYIAKDEDPLASVFCGGVNRNFRFEPPLKGWGEICLNQLETRSRKSWSKPDLFFLFEGDSSQVERANVSCRVGYSRYDRVNALAMVGRHYV